MIATVMPFYIAGGEAQGSGLFAVLCTRGAPDLPILENTTIIPVKDVKKIPDIY
jgi:hypothetical protein